MCRLSLSSYEVPCHEICHNSRFYATVDRGSCNDSCTRHAADMHHVYLTNKDSQDPILKNDATNATSILLYWGQGVRLEQYTMPVNTTAQMIIDAGVANNVLTTTLLSSLPQTHDINVYSKQVVQLSGAVPSRRSFT